MVLIVLDLVIWPPQIILYNPQNCWHTRHLGPSTAIDYFSQLTMDYVSITDQAHDTDRWRIIISFLIKYRKISITSRTKSQNLNVCRLVLQLSLSIEARC